MDIKKKKIHEIFQPSTPIQAIERLAGRDDEVKQICDSLETPGRNVFVYGERGVGKTSLARTSANQFSSSSIEPVYIACNSDTTFQKIAEQVTRKILQGSVIESTEKRESQIAVSAKLISYVRKVQAGDEVVDSELDINDAVDLMKELYERKKDAENIVVIIDELEALESKSSTKKHIAEFVKQMGDQACPIKFILVGIADDVSEVFEGHASTSRYLATIKLNRLGLEVISEMVEKGFRALGGKIFEPLPLRIACISDGFAHYAHLVALKTALAVYEQGAVEFNAYIQHYEKGLKEAIRETDAWLGATYKQATQKYQDKYEPALWSVADHYLLEQPIDAMVGAYNRICSSLDREPESRTEYGKNLNKLSKEAHGEVLVSTRRGWYKFRHSMLRGYCRMIANERGVKVGMEYLGKQVD